MLELTAENFDEVTATGAVLVDFWAPWCAPCLKLGPVLEAVVEGLEKMADPSYKIAKVNVEAQMSLGSRFQVRSIPCLIMFRDGVEVARTLGYRDQADLVAWVHQVLGIQ